jgi:hypothetical protein
LQHLFDKDSKEIKEMYSETGELAASILEKAEAEGFDEVVFLSDHGLPTEKQHNKQAFYSATTNDLFEGVEKPHICDFKYEILSLVNPSILEVSKERLRRIGEEPLEVKS